MVIPKMKQLSCNTDLQDGHNHHSGQVGPERQLECFHLQGTLLVASGLSHPLEREEQPSLVAVTKSCPRTDA